MLTSYVLYFDRIIQDLKLSRQNIYTNRPSPAPFLSFLHKIFDVTIIAKPFVFLMLKHEILSWPPTYPVMYGVMRSFGSIKTKTLLPFAFGARVTCAHFWSASTQT